MMRTTYDLDGLRFMVDDKYDNVVVSVDVPGTNGEYIGVSVPAEELLKVFRKLKPDPGELWIVQKPNSGWANCNIREDI